jgi:hypothetical protein
MYDAIYGHDTNIFTCPRECSSMSFKTITVNASRGNPIRLSYTNSLEKRRGEKHMKMAMRREITMWRKSKSETRKKLAS